MNTRTCANCAAFIEDSIAEPSSCMNLVSFIISQGNSREPGPDDSCDMHQTHEEYRAETQRIMANPDPTLADIMEQLENEDTVDDDRDRLHQAEINADRMTQAVLGKLRKV